MTKIIALALLVAATSAMALASQIQAPEIDASTGMGALTLLSGAVLVLRSRRK